VALEGAAWNFFVLVVMVFAPVLVLLAGAEKRTGWSFRGQRRGTLAAP
jgi:hypothetical protein